MLLFRRSDGDLVRGEAPGRRFLAFMMPRRNDAAIYHEQVYDVTTTRPWLRAFNRQQEQNNDQPATLFHLFLWAFGQSMHRRPGLNRFVLGGRLYQRKGVFISFVAKREFEESAPYVTMKVEFPKGEPFADCVKRITSAIKDGRTGPARTVDKELELSGKLPGPVLRFVLWALGCLDRVNLMPAGMIANDPMYTSMFVANLGSVGLDRTFHHLYEYGTAGMFGVLGAIKKMPVPGRDGQTTIRDVLEVRWTLDERINDGYYCANGLKLARQVIENPAPYIDGLHFPGEPEPTSVSATDATEMTGPAAAALTSLVS